MKRMFIAVLGLFLLTACSSSSTEPKPTNTLTMQDCSRYMVWSSTASGDNALPDIGMECLQGTDELRVSALKGPMIMPVWASWCMPCAREMPRIQEFADLYGDRVGVLGLALMDTEEQAIAGSLNWGVTIPSIEDRDGAFRADFGIQAPPTTLFIDQSGHIVYRHIGEIENLALLKTLVAEHLGVEL
jgi:thiol-disulfide isomerase/thioredoxin